MFALWGVIAVAMGAGDYYNVFNALTQMPKGARTYLYQMNSYWYILKINKNKFQKINLFSHDLAGPPICGPALFL